MSTSRSHAQAVQLARETRERFVQATQGIFVPAATAIRERLAGLASQTGNARAMQAHRDDFLAFQAKASDWIARAESGWSRATLATTAAGVLPTALSGLTLIEDEVVENSILASRMAQLIAGQAGFELNDLRLRIQHLEGTTELDSRDVLKPETLSRVLIDQWLHAGLSRQVWINVQAAVQQQLLDVVVAAYKEANAFLIGRGVMPEIDLTNFVRRTGGAGPSGAMPLNSGSGLAGSISGGSSRALASGQYEPAVGYGNMGAPPGSFAPAAIGVGMRRGADGPAVFDDLRGGAESMVATGGSPLLMARHRAQGVLVNLKRFVAARTGGDSPAGAVQPVAGGVPGGGYVAGGGGSRAFVAAIADAELAHQVTSTGYVVGKEATALRQTAADLRRSTSELKKIAPTTADKATVEIVALMFQAILAEERIPFSARVWFARLQMPVLRVAIAEPEFFGTLQHPARMLIDRMGSCVIGFDPAAISGSALESEIRRVVQVIEQYPETGQRVFKLVFDEFVVFLGRYLTQSDATQRVMNVAQQVEQKETMAIQYTIELRKMLDDMPVREEIREFLFKVWAEVLAIAALRYGGQAEQTVTFKRAASELVWAASAKPNRNDRARVIQDLPKLLQRLRQGMALLGIVDAPQEAYIKVIGTTLSDAFMSKTEAIPHAKIEAMAERLTHLEDLVTDEGTSGFPLDAASIELLLGVDAASIEVIPDIETGARVAEDMMAWVHELQVGTWFMLDHNARPSQVQFVWRSDRKQLHLFASTDGRSFLIQAGRLASYLQAGLLVPAEEETLTERATREALARLDANPERLLN